jgi:hypothetical protein
LRVLPKPDLLALCLGALTAALVVVSLAIPIEKPVAAKASQRTPAFDYGGNPPTFVLMKGPEVIQKGSSGAPCWFWWKEYTDSVEERKNREGYWTGYCYALAVPINKADLYPRDAVLVAPGSTLHIRIYHARRPDRVQLVEGLKPNNGELPWGSGRLWQDYTLRRVERDDETYAWDVFFRVKERDHRYYLYIWAQWDRVPGTHKSYGDNRRSFHVKTR